MSDFVVWMSPEPVPAAIYRRWNWSPGGRLGTRRTESCQLGRASTASVEVAAIGQGLGTRSRREFISGDDLAKKLLTDLPRAGPGGLDRYLGSVAGAMVNRTENKALIWRDRFGRHPLQMIRLDTGWVITSAPELVSALSASRPQWSNIQAFIHGDAQTTDTDVLTDIFRVRPAEYVEFYEFSPSQKAIWWTPSPRFFASPVDEAGALLRSLGSLYGKHPHALTLSSGLDSATLAAMASVVHPATEAVTFSDPSSHNDETEGARELAAHLGLRWRPFEVTEHWPLSRLTDHRFPPAWGPAAHPDAAWKMPFHRWLRARRGSMPVMYGNGADELLWVPSTLWLRDRWADGDISALVEAFEHLPFKSWIRPAISEAIDGLGLRSLRERLPSLSDSRPPWQRSEDWITREPPGADLVDPGSATKQYFQLRLRRLQTWRWERIMRSLAAESRRANRPIWTPFLDAEFWELGLSLSPMNLVEGGRQKSILRQATDNLLHEACRRRPKVGGFDPLVERGLADRGSKQVYTLLARQRLGGCNGFDGDAFVKAYEAYRRRPLDDGPRRYRGSWPIWRTLATELWLRRLTTGRKAHWLHPRR